MAQTVAKRDAQQLQQNQATASQQQVHEKHASANASAGLNLNLFGALSGAFSSKQKKSTRVDDDGSIVSEQERQDKAEASALARAQANARAAAGAEQSEMKRTQQRVDHLGIEG
ncbi:palmitoyltransferase swf1 [Exserohilum turcicum]